jgi:PAS domain S-box-containing protein
VQVLAHFAACQGRPLRLRRIGSGDPSAGFISFVFSTRLAVQAPLPPDEAERLEILRKYNILDTLPEQSLDELTRMAASICEAPISLISLVDEARQWFKSRHGVDAVETHRDMAFCAHAILKPDELLVVPDACADERFADNALVTGDPNIGFYAGAPLVTSDGFPLGTLCVIDRKPRVLSEEQLLALGRLRDHVVLQLERRRFGSAHEGYRRMEAFLETTLDGIITVDEEGVIETFNPAAERIFGYDASEVLGKSLTILFPAAFRNDQFLASALVGDGRGREGMGIRKDGRSTPVEFAVNQLDLDDHRSYIGVVRDLSEQRRVQRELDRFFTMSLDLLSIANFEGHFTKLNPSWEAALGWTCEEMLATPYMELIHPEDREATTLEVGKLIEGREIINFENRFRCKDGSYRWLLWSAAMHAEEQALYAVARDITGRKESEDMLLAVNRELEEKSAALEQATRHKSEFLANMSHELRTPMNSIIGFTARVLKRAGEQLPERQKRNLEIVERNARHLLHLINDLLDISKIEAGKMEIFAETFLLQQLIDEARELAPALIGEKDLRLVVEVGQPGAELFTDHTKLKQVLINLISNAVKFTEAGTVTLSAHCLSSEAGDSLVLSVSDTGMGISQEALGQIFESFKRVETGIARDAGGTGLGLAITKNITTLLGGDLEVESEPGKGSTFTVTIPARLPETVLAAVPNSENGLSAEAPTVLCIDDEPEALDLLSQSLGDAGFNVITAQSGLEGIAKARAEKPLAITLDIDMPKVDGWAVLRRLKRDELTREIPVVMVTVLNNRKRAYKMGALEHLQKPVDPEQLVSVLLRGRADRPQSVLLVDDDAEVRELVRETLQDLDIQVIEAENGVEALQAVERAIPDLIILDLMMPEMGGLETLRWLHQNENWAKIPVCVVTAKNLTIEERAFLRNHAVNIVEKDGEQPENVLASIVAELRQLQS